MTFASPLAFWAFLIIPCLIYIYLRTNRQRGSLPFSDLSATTNIAISWRQRLIHLPFILQLLAISLIIVGLARPQEGIEKMETINHGIAIEVVVDRSSSMGAELTYKGQNMNRLDAVKLAFNDFIMGDGHKLKGRPNDLIGMVAFAGFAETICPLTLAHGAVQGFVDQVKLVQKDERHEDGTAIGDGIALAAARLKQASEVAEKDAQTEGRYQVKSKIIILLTDGINNSGSHSPMAAAALAKEWGIKVYAIGIGDKPSKRFGIFSMGQQQIDTATLKAISEHTGGHFWLAEQGESLAEIYKIIDELETSEIESIQYLDYNEHFSNFILAGLALLIMATFTNWFLLDRIP